MILFLQDVNRSIGPNIYFAPSAPVFTKSDCKFICSMLILFSDDVAAVDKNVIAEIPVSEVTV